MVKVTINCDMGEAFGIYRFGDDEACMPFITHANVACGFHASDPVVMRETVCAAKRHGVAIGAHPGLPDREGFGRREMKLSRDEVSALVLYQTGALQAFAAAEGVALAHIKPHGALFGMAQREEAIAEGIADAALATGLPVIAYSDCAMSEVFTRRGIAFSCEFYADLDYDDDGRQIIAKQHRAVSVVGERRSAVQDAEGRQIGRATGTDAYGRHPAIIVATPPRPACRFRADADARAHRGARSAVAGDRSRFGVCP